MSTLWTPDGERPIPRAAPDPASESPPAPVAAGDEAPTPEDEAKMAELREELSRIPAEIMIANHAYGLFQLAAVHLSCQPPQLAQARTAIDALGALVEGMAGRLGEPEKDLVEALSQLRMGFVQVRAETGGSDPAV